MKAQLSLKQAWLYIIVCIVLVPAITATVWYGYQEFDRQLKASLAIERISNQALSIAVNTEVKRLMSVLKNKSDPLSILADHEGKIKASEEMYRLMKMVMIREPAIRELMIVGPNSTVVAAIDTHLGVNGSMATIPELLEKVATHWGFNLNNNVPEVVIPLAGRNYIGSPRKHDDYFAFSMSVPIGYINQGVLIAIIDVHKIWEDNYHLESGVGAESTNDYLLDRRGSLMSTIDGTPWKIADIMTHLPIVRSALISESWSANEGYIGVTGEAVYGTYTTVPSIGWVLISEVIASKIKTPILHGLYQTFAVIIFLMFMFVWFATWMAKRTIQPINNISVAINQFAGGEPVDELELSGIAELDGISRDLTRMIGRRDKVLGRLRLSDRVFRETHEGILVTCANKKILDVNPALCAMTGYTREELIGETPSILNSGKHDRQFFLEMWKDIRESGHWYGEIWNRKKDGELYAELLTVSVLLSADGSVKNYVGMSSDITNIKNQQQTLELMAHYDVLTQLPNRMLFTDRFSQAIAHSNRAKNSVAICFIDLDEFKPVNDKYGHGVGDQLLVEVANRLKATIREDDTVSRQGGDEFTLLLGDIYKVADCEQMLKRIHLSLAEPYLIDGQSIVISASSGATIYPADDADLDMLIRHADQAMYEAKQYGRNCYKLFNAAEDKAVVERIDRLSEIRDALSNNEFQLYFQPKVNMATGDVYGAEALIRWIHPEKGLIPPLDFLPHIDGSVLEIEVGDWVIEQALKQLEQWSEHGLDLEVSVNIASYHLMSADFVTRLGDVLERHKAVDPSHLQLEILESSALSNLTVISGIIKTCRESLGVSVALDDFGTGYSSLTHLRNLPANVIKIDQTFVRDMLDDPDDFAIIDGVLGLADAFGRGVIAEGVETTEHGLMLLVMGCQRAQGYGIARPMPADDIPRWYKNYEPNEEWLLCANTQRNLNDFKIEQFWLALNQWKAKFESAVHSGIDDVTHWPIMEKSHCHCGFWIKRAWKEQLFEGEWLLTLDQSHENIHVIANDMMADYNDGNVELAKQNLGRFNDAYDTVKTTLRNHRV